MLTHSLEKALRILIVLGLLTFGLGCQNPTSTVSGTVSVNGEPLTNGWIEIENADGMGRTIDSQITDGRFEIPQVEVGPKIVRILARKFADGLDSDSATTESTDSGQQYLPGKYNALTELTLDVVAPKTQQDYNLEITMD
ncbi:MAG: hypothetical protein KDB03_06630 [Planctomycetales bacterium]|nr:hypothetical protein [Planctomycetales bacterium]